jgi:hypothetical protein
MGDLDLGHGLAATPALEGNAGGYRGSRACGKAAGGAVVKAWRFTAETWLLEARAGALQTLFADAGVSPPAWAAV